VDHPSEIQLHRYLDRELSVEEQERIAAHLVTCATCRARVDAYAHLGALLRASLPDPAAFAPVGETWRSIAGRLQPRPSPRWPLLPLLPPFLLAAIGTVAQVALALIVTTFALSAWGLVPAPATVMAGGIHAILGHPWLEGSLYAWLGWSSVEVVQAATTRWQALHTAAQHVIILGAVILAPAAALGVVAVLDLVWAICWPGAARRETEGGM